MSIQRCTICGCWLASSNTSFIEKHISNCQISAKYVSWCIASIDNKEIKVAVEPNDRGKFKILWIENKYKNLINKYIDASQIRRVIVKDPPDYCTDDFKK